LRALEDENRKLKKLLAEAMLYSATIWMGWRIAARKRTPVGSTVASSFLFPEVDATRSFRSGSRPGGRTDPR
ncbi:MAG: hypothetical protein P8Y78_11725, partial [Acidihalobacter sp.]